MKRMHTLLLAGSLVFGVSTIAKAQSSASEPFEYPSQNSLNYTIDEFYRSFNTRYANFESSHVEGQKLDSKALGEMCRIIVSRLGNFSVESTDASYIVNAQNHDLITVNFTLKFDDYGLNFHIAQPDSVMLKRHVANKITQWLIVPGDPQTYSDSKANQPISGITKNIATLVAFPERLLPVVHLNQSMAQLKAIGFAMFYFLQDYDERLDFTQQNFSDKLKLYVRNPSIFTAPGDPPGTISFDVNPNIVGKPLAELDNEPAEIVAFYLGHDQKLDFRYEGLSPVCFMDGHVKAISPEEAKSLRWKP